MAASPSELHLSFSEGVKLKFTGIAVTGPAGAVPTGAAALTPGDNKVLVVPLADALARGRYKVDRHALATDGHKTDDTYGFTVEPCPVSLTIAPRSSSPCSANPSPAMA